MNNKETRRPAIIGITGGIGSGKSYVSAFLKERFGIPVYDCDSEAKRLTASDPEIQEKLTALVGKDVFQNGELNRQLLANFLFADLENASEVNAIIHPTVLRDFRKWVEQKQELPAVALESAILYESGFDACADTILFVDAPEDVRLGRAMLRDTATEEKIRARMKMQSPELNRLRADFIIDNSQTDNPLLLKQLNAVLEKMKLKIEK